MKNNIVSIMFAALLLTVASCQEKPLDPNSQIIDSKVEMNDFDKWLVDNYTTPYNIDFKYRMEMNESDMNYWLVPAEYDKSIMMAKLMKHLCLEPYDEITGSKDFIRAYYPKMIHLIGSAAYKNNNTFVLGTAEGGLKITMYMVNDLTPTISIDDLNYYYFKTMHHEFSHILHQTKPYSTDFNAISGPDYVTDAWSSNWKSEAEALQNGFISEYASKEANEDFVELIAIYVTSTADEWNAMLKTAGTTGQPKIAAKFEIAYNYMKTTWNIDLDQLRDIIQRRQGEISTLELDKL